MRTNLLDPRTLIRLLVPLLFLGTAVAFPYGAGAVHQEQEEEIEALLGEERAEADRLRRRGDLSAARKLLGRHLRDDEGDSRSRALLARVYLDQAGWARAEKHAVRALEDCPQEDRETRAACVRVLADLLHTLGRDEEAYVLLADEEECLAPRSDARDAWRLAEVRRSLGQRQEAEVILRLGASSGSDQGWEGLLCKARCSRRLGKLEEADRSLILADRIAREGEGEEPDILSALGDLYFEADREVAEGASRSASRAYDLALGLDPGHEGALLGMVAIHRVNWHRHRRSAGEFLAEALDRRPDSIEALLVACSADFTIGKLRSVRSRLERLEELAPKRREVRFYRAALSWIEHEREACESILASLLETAPTDSTPEREVGRTLVELYRFAEGLPFLERAVSRDTSDHEAWTLLGRARANTGDEKGALEALIRSRHEADRRQDAWRKNTIMVLERLQRDYVSEDHGALSFAWSPDAAEVLATYLEPFYREAREELAERYGFTPEPAHIEVFRHHRDFSVRSTGFQGFPALGVCFGPVVTALSPLSELRGSFSWARTSFHEFTHVIHLGLSHNRCPRWITEGLATWEEKNKNRAWDRNLRRELIDARANGDIFPVRDLNAAFRGSRIIFGYYQGGLICEMLIGRFGFPPVIRLLEAFDRGDTLDEALQTVYGLTPEELDEQLLEFIDLTIADLAIEPRWDPRVLPRLRLSLPREVPEEEEGLIRWRRIWCSIGWGAWQQGSRIDAEEALRQVRRAGPEPPRALFLRGEMELANGERKSAREFFEGGFAAGGEDFRARIALGSLLMGADEYTLAEEHFLAAERAFPGFAEAGLCAELKLVALYTRTERADEANRAAERYLAYDAGNYTWRRRVAKWHADAGRWRKAASLLNEANEIDPFSRSLHREWGEALERLEEWEDALREYRVAVMVPDDLDSSGEGPLSESARAELLAKQAECLRKLGRDEEAKALEEESGE
jgi:tetratricopeptide (TPR) repeat protein